MIKGGLFALVLGVVGLALLAGMGMAWEQFPPALYEPSIEPVRAGQERSIKRAAFAAGRLWLLSDAGELWTVREGVHEARGERLPEPALDLCVQDGRPVVVTGQGPKFATWTLRQRAGSSWMTIASIASRGEGLAGVACAESGLILLTARRLVQFGKGAPTELRLSQRVPAGLTSALVALPDALFVGANAGEFGGGLMRIDRHTADTVAIHSNPSGDPCRGPLNRECDPVTALAPEPWKAGCVAAAIGMIHMSTHGRIVEVCGRQVRRLYFRPCPSDGSAPVKRLSANAEPFCTEAFFGLQQKGDALWAVGVRGLLRIDRAGAVERSPLPPFEAYGPFAISFASPQFALVLTEANQRLSLSGAVPLMAPR